MCKRIRSLLFYTQLCSRVPKDVLNTELSTWYSPFTSSNTDAEPRDHTGFTGILIVERSMSWEDMLFMNSLDSSVCLVYSRCHCSYSHLVQVQRRHLTAARQWCFVPSLLCSLDNRFLNRETAVLYHDPNQSTWWWGVWARQTKHWFKKKSFNTHLLANV